MAMEMAPPGLHDVLVTETGICELGPGRLAYRGYAIEDLAAHCRFEEVAHLLIYGALPSSAQLADLRTLLAGYRALPAEIRDLLRLIPTNVPMMAVFRTMVSMCAHFDPVEGHQPADRCRRAVWLLATLGSLLTFRCRLVRRQLPLDPKPGLSYAAQVLYQIHGEGPSAESERLLDVFLLLYAEHELNAATFTERVIGSTRADQVSAVVGAIAALQGRLVHGVERVAALMGDYDDPDRAVRRYEEVLATENLLPGFGHGVYVSYDPRAVILEAQARTFADQHDRVSAWETHEAVKEQVLSRREGAFPNVDFVAALVLTLLGLPHDLGTPLMVAGRLAGWSAHYLEQLTQSHVYRPRARYVGPVERRVDPSSP